MLEDGGALPEEDGDQMMEYKALHEENFLSSRLREDVAGGKAEMKEWRKKDEEDESKGWERAVERETEKIVLKRRCASPVSNDVFE